MKLLIVSLVLFFGAQIASALMLDSMPSVELSKTLTKPDQQPANQDEIVAGCGGEFFDSRCSSAEVLGNRTPQQLTQHFFNNIQDG